MDVCDECTVVFLNNHNFKGLLHLFLIATKVQQGPDSKDSHELDPPEGSLLGFSDQWADSKRAHVGRGAFFSGAPGGHKQYTIGYWHYNTQRHIYLLGMVSGVYVGTYIFYTWSVWVFVHQNRTTIISLLGSCQGTSMKRFMKSTCNLPVAKYVLQSLHVKDGSTRKG